MTNAARIRRHWAEITALRDEGHKMSSIYKAMIKAGLIECSWNNFTKVYYAELNKPVKSDSVAPSVDSSPAAAPTRDRKVNMLGSFDRNAEIAQAKAAFKNNRREK